MTKHQILSLLDIVLFFGMRIVALHSNYSWSILRTHGRVPFPQTSSIAPIVATEAREVDEDWWSNTGLLSRCSCKSRLAVEKPFLLLELKLLLMGIALRLDKKVGKDHLFGGHSGDEDLLREENSETIRLFLILLPWVRFNSCVLSWVSSAIRWLPFLGRKFRFPSSVSSECEVFVVCIVNMIILFWYWL